MAPGMEPNDLLGMSLDQISSRSGRFNKTGSSSGAVGGAWSGGGPVVGEARGRDGGGGGMRSEISRPQSVVGGGTFRSAIASTRASHQSGPIRRSGVARSARESTAPYQRPIRTSESIFDRLGGKVGDEPGIRVKVQGLNHDVMQEDIDELFSGVGELLHCGIDFDYSGRSNGTAIVVFKKREDAESAVAQFHNRTLDGTPMHVEIVESPKPRLDSVRGRGHATVGERSGGGGSGGSTWRESQNGSRASNGTGRGGYSGGLGGAGDGRAAPLPGGNRLIASAINRLPQSRAAVPPYSRSSQPPPRPSRIPNVRENLFGTALDGDEMKDVPVADLDDVVVPSMNGFGGGGGGGGERGGRRERNEQSNVSFQVTVTTPPDSMVGGGGGSGGGGGFRNRGDSGSNSFLSRNGGGGGRAGLGGGGMRSSGGGGGRRGGNRGGGGGGYTGGRKSARDAISTVDLDAQLDAHMAKG